MIKKWRERFSSKWGIIGLILTSLVMAFFVQSFAKLEDPLVLPEIDTMIPRGFVLVPISVQNSESLDSVFGSHGIVDLYSVNETSQGKGRRVASGVKLLRAPKNPSQFGVLIEDRYSGLLLNEGATFFVVIHHPHHTGTPIEVSPKKPKRRIILEEGA